MIIQISRIKQLCIVVATIFTLNGCLLTDSFKREMIEEYEENTKTTTLKEIQEQVDDLNSLKADIARLLDLEADFNYFTQQINDNKVHGSAGDIKPLNADDLILNDISDAIEMQSTEINDGWVTGSTLNSVQLNPAPSVLSKNIKSSESITDENKDLVNIDSKFSDKNESLNSNQRTQSLNQRSANSMVSINADGKFLQTGMDNCNRSKNAYGKLSAHLASYSTMAHAEKGWETFKNKYNTQLCALSPVVNEVVVNGKTFLSLRAGPLSTEIDVQKICTSMRVNGDYCAQALFEGQPLYRQAEY